MVSKIEELLKLVKSEKEKAIDEFTYLQRLTLLLEEAEERFPKIREPKVLKANIKSLQRHCRRAVKRAGNLEKKVERLRAELVLKINELLRYLPAEYKQDFFSLKFDKEISVSAENLVNYASRKEGLLRKGIEAAEFNVDKVFALVKEAIEKGTRPFLASLEQLESWLEKNQTGIEAEIGKTLNFNLDFGEVFRRGSLPAKGIKVLLDASFAKEVSEEKKKQGKQGYNLSSLRKLGELVIPKKIQWEMEIKPLWLGRPLVPRELRNYLLSLGAKVIEVTPTEKEKKRIIGLWRGTTKGRNSTLPEEEKFEKSGDMSLLTYCLRQGRNSSVILSNDSDLRETARELRQEGIAVRVIELKEGRLSLAA